MNDQGVQIESEFVFRRLTETIKVFGSELDGRFWLFALAVVLTLGIGLVIYMYVKDSRSVSWKWATPLALLRITVYLILAVMFLMPARQGYERAEKRSRVIIAFDVSGSVAQVSDDAPTAKLSSTPHTRLNRIMDFLSDERVGFLKSILDKNPVTVYRFGSRLDEDAQVIEKGADGVARPVHKLPGADGALAPVAGEPWANEDWQAFAAYDFKPWLIRGLSADGAAKVKATKAWDGNVAGTADWAQKWFDAKDEAVPGDLTPVDKTVLDYNRDRLVARIDVARSIGTATNLPDSLVSLLNREAGNMVQGIVVFSDGQSNLGGAGSGSDAALTEFRSRTSREKIPVFTVTIGSDQKHVAVRFTDLVGPDQTPPDEPWKVVAELDGEGLVGRKATVSLEIQLPKSEGTAPVRIPLETTYQPGEPPHAQVEFVLDPEKVPDALKNKQNPKELVEGEWRLRAVTPRVEGERFQDKEHVSEWITVKVQKKAQRVLVVCSAPNRDVQFLITQLLRDKADMSLFVQNEAGGAGKINLLEDPERQLVRFPDRLNVEELSRDVAGPDRWYNLAQYDVVVTFDMDWSAITPEQISMLQTWVDLNAGGLLFVAGHIFTEHLARPEANNKFGPLLDILPVLPGDPALAAAKRTATQPWRLEFENLGGDLEFMKIDDDKARPETGWELFFTGREEREEKATVIRGFFNYFPVRQMKPVATPVARFPDPNAIKMPDGKAPPWLAVMQFGQGRTGWVGSPEIWRLRQYKQDYFERFWTKFIRYLGAGSRRKQTRRGRILMNPLISQGQPIRVQEQALDASLQPADPKLEPKLTLRPIELDRYPAEIEKLVGDETIAKAKAKYHEKFTYEFRMSAKKGAGKWEGWYTRMVPTSAEKFPTGTWRADGEVPSSTEVTKYKFMIRQSNPELDVTRPDLKAMYQIASPVTDIQTGNDANLAQQIRDQFKVGGNEGVRLTCRFGDENTLKVIPECFKPDVKTFRNRGAVEDYWDRGIDLPSFLTSWYSDKPQRLAYGLLLCVGLLSVEWLTRKLLKLA